MTNRIAPAVRGSGSLPLLAVCLAYFMVILDATAVNVMLPTLRDDLGASFSELQWVIDAYVLTLAALLLAGGSLADRWGSRAVFLFGTVLFTGASVACGLAPTTVLLIVTRAIQGIGAALAVPASLALLRVAYPDAADRARAFGVWAGVAGIAAASGPVLGGVLATAVGWRAVFLVNLPIGVAGLWLAIRHVPRTVAERPRAPFDAPAQLAAILSLAGLAVALIEAGHLGWRSLPVVLGFATFLAAGAALVATERRSAHPLLPPWLFRDATFSAGTAVGLLLNLGFYGQLFVMNLYFQQQRGYSALLAGLAVVPQAALVSLASVLSGRLTARRGPRPAMLGGLAVGAAGLLALAAVGRDTPYWLLVVPLMAAGFGIAFTMPAATTAVVGAVPPERAGLAAGVINAARQVGGVVGVALLGTLVIGSANFIAGLHVALAVAGASFVLAWVVTLLALHPRRSPQRT